MFLQQTHYIFSMFLKLLLFKCLREHYITRPILSLWYGIIAEECDSVPASAEHLYNVVPRRCTNILFAGVPPSLGAVTDIVKSKASLKHFFSRGLPVLHNAASRAKMQRPEIILSQDN